MNKIIVEVSPHFIETRSSISKVHYVFAYTVNITNTGTTSAKLLSRHWIIIDSNSKVEEVKGEGVVGEQPYLRPGESFQYNSGAIIDTPIGTMHGSYMMQSDEGVNFVVLIPKFTLSIPRTLH